MSHYLYLEKMPSNPKPSSSVCLSLFLLFAVSLIENPFSHLLSQSARGSHPFHVTTAEARWNPESGRLEISVRCHPIDLENAIRAMTGKKVDLDQTPEIDSMISEYLKKNFILRNPSTKTENKADKKVDENEAKKKDEPQQGVAKLHWVGKEIDSKWAWIYFELEPDSGAGDLTLTNTLLMEVLEDQTNTVLVLQGTKRKSLLFRANNKTKQFPRVKDFDQIESATKTSEVKPQK